MLSALSFTPFFGGFWSSLEQQQLRCKVLFVPLIFSLNFHLIGEWHDKRELRSVTTIEWTDWDRELWKEPIYCKEERRQKRDNSPRIEVTDVGSTLSNQVETISEKIMYFLELFIKREGSSTKSLV